MYCAVALRYLGRNAYGAKGAGRRFETGWPVRDENSRIIRAVRRRVTRNVALIREGLADIRTKRRKSGE